nr:hypothetical protein [Candidatus Hakubella thermalkaliphila]
MGRLRQARSGDALDIQILVGNRAVLPHERKSKFVVKVFPLVLDVLVQLRQMLNRLAASIATFLLSCDGSLSATEFVLCLSVEPGWVNALSIGCGQEGLQAQVDADGSAQGSNNLNLGQLA